MAFTVTDLRDFLNLLREHPEWRAEVRREVLGEELLSLPDLIRQNGEDIRELKTVVAQNSADIRQNSEDIRELRLTVAELSAGIASLVGETRELKSAFLSLEGRLGDTAGEVAEMRWKNHYHGRFGRRIHRAKLLEPPDLTLFEDAARSRVISRDEALAIRHLDLIIEGLEEAGDAEWRPALLAVEVSMTIDSNDVDRAARRAEILRRVGYNAYGIVAGTRINGRVRTLAEERGVQVLLEGEEAAANP